MAALAAALSTMPTASALAGLDISLDVAGLPLGVSVDPTAGSGLVAVELPVDLGISTGAATGGLLDLGSSASTDAEPMGSGRVTTTSSGGMPLPPAEVAVPAAVATVGLLWLLLGPLKYGLASVLMPLYSRIAKSELLDNEGRNRIFGLVQAQPGIALREIEATTGMGFGTVVYHLQRLEQARMVVSKRDGNYRRFFVNGEHATRKDEITALRNVMAHRIAGFIVARPGVSQTEVCREFGIGPSLAHKHVARLEGANLVRKEREWKMVRYHPTDALAGAMGVVGNAPEPALQPGAAPPAMGSPVPA